MPAKFRVEITPSAERDAEEIRDYISHDSPSRASAFVRRLEEQVAALERFPSRCPLIPENELLDTEYRHLLFGEYRTIFKITGRTVFILRIVHGARLLDESFLER